VAHLIELDDIEVSHGRGRNVILQDLDLRVRAGEFVTVVGPSGCGKSTLLNLVLGAHFPTSGTVLVEGEPVWRVTRDRGIVYQTYGLFPHLTVLDNIALGPVLEQTSPPGRCAAMPFLWAGALGKALVGSFTTASRLGKILPGRVSEGAEEILSFGQRCWDKTLGRVGYCRVREEARELALELLKGIGLEPKDADKFPHELSGGMRQRVSIAQSLAMKPKILLMDEPFGALDPHTRSAMQDLIHEQWRQDGITIVFVTHDLDEACKLGTRLVVLSQHWQHDDGQPNQGARIVIDRKVTVGGELPSKTAETAEFQELVASSRSAFDPRCRRRVSEFDLTHPDAC
jgi:NitT/TauT family transport system ATP-binding protein